MKELDGTEYGLLGGLFDNKEELVSVIGGTAINSNSSMTDIINHLKGPDGTIWSILKGNSTSNTVGGYIKGTYDAFRNKLSQMGVTTTGNESLWNLTDKISEINVGKKFASGTVALGSSGSVVIRGLSFKPTSITLTNEKAGRVSVWTTKWRLNRIISMDGSGGLSYQTSGPTLYVDGFSMQAPTEPSWSTNTINWEAIE